MHIVLISALCIVAAFTVGCSRTGTAPTLADEVVLPRGGAPLSSEAARAIRTAANEAEELSAEGLVQERVFWALPVVSRKFRVDHTPGSNDIVISDYSMIALGIPKMYLPIQFSFSRYEYPAHGGDPDWYLQRRYWPWWSWVDQSEDPLMSTDVLEADLGGIPLLYESGSERGPSWYFSDTETTFNTEQEFSFFTAAWWLGPLFFDQKLTGENEEGNPRITDGYYLFPLTLGLAPGALLWTSTDRAETDGPRQYDVTAHGPLLGYLGYYRERDNAGEDAGSRRLLWLGGALWYEAADPDRVGVVAGPLWGLGGLLRW